MKKFYTLLALAFFSAACGSGGGSEIGNPGDTVLRPVIGTVSMGGNPSLAKSVGKSSLGDTCGADAVQATDAAGNVSTTELADDCSLSIELETGTSYLIGFLHDDTFVASLIVQNSATLLDSAIFYLAAGTDPVDLGEIIISGNDATPTNQPARQNDRDDDGESDFDDDDDDDDGKSDDDEDDCDLDGFLDDDDDDACEAEEED